MLFNVIIILYPLFHANFQSKTLPNFQNFLRIITDFFLTKTMLFNIISLITIHKYTASFSVAAGHV